MTVKHVSEEEGQVRGGRAQRSIPFAQASQNRLGRTIGIKLIPPY